MEKRKKNGKKEEKWISTKILDDQMGNSASYQ